MLSNLKSLGRDAVVYGLGGIASKMLPLALLPVYLQIFTVQEYGILEIVNIAVGMIAGMALLGMDSAESFYFTEQKAHGTQAQAEVLSAILELVISCGLLASIGGWAAAGFFNERYLDGAVSSAVLIWAFAALPFVNVAVLTASLFRLLFKPWKYVGLSLCASILTSVLGLLFAVWAGWGIAGFFAGSLVGWTVSAVLGLWFARDYLRPWRWHALWYRRLLAFGVPLIPMSAAMWLMNSMGRWFLATTHGTYELGVVRRRGQVCDAVGVGGECIPGGVVAQGTGGHAFGGRA